MMKRPTFFSLGCCLALAACSSQVVVTDITDANKTTLITGIPFRINTQQRLHIYELSPTGDDYVEVAQTLTQLPDQKKLYAVGFKGDVFSTRSLRVIANSDNTLKSVQLTTTGNTAGVLDSLSGTVAGIEKAKVDANNATLASAKNDSDAQKAVRDAQKELDALPATTSVQTRQAFQSVLEAAKRQANDAAAAVGRPAPYPDAI